MIISVSIFMDWLIDSPYEGCADMTFLGIFFHAEEGSNLIHDPTTLQIGGYTMRNDRYSRL